ncbi:MAG: LysR substrate-binding domain-containing protein [Geminicoccaceae bacterium]
MKPLPLSSLQAFEAAARTGSFRAAAAELGISASAVSHAIRKLEDLLGASLFEREGRSVQLNPYGNLLAAHVGRGFDELRQGMELVGARSANLLRLHCAPSMAAQWLTPRLMRLARDLPGLEVRLHASADYHRFQNDEVDADISYGPPRLEGMISIPLGQEIVCPLCSPELARSIHKPADLLDQALIESERKRIRWDSWFAANGLAPPRPRGYRFDRSFMAIAAAVNGIGVALESTRLVEAELAAGRLVAPLRGLSNDIEYTGHYLVFPGTAKPRKAVRMFAVWLMRELGLPPPNI